MIESQSNEFLKFIPGYLGLTAIVLSLVIFIYIGYSSNLFANEAKAVSWSSYTLVALLSLVTAIFAQPILSESK